MRPVCWCVKACGRTLQRAPDALGHAGPQERAPALPAATAAASTSASLPTLTPAAPAAAPSGPRRLFVGIVFALPPGKAIDAAAVDPLKAYVLPGSSSHQSWLY